MKSMTEDIFEKSLKHEQMRLDIKEKRRNWWLAPIALIISVLALFVSIIALLLN